MPTQSARNHLEKNHGDVSRCVEAVRDGKIVPELHTIFGLIKDFDAVLATAHLSPQDCFTMVEAARNAGAKKIVITHPEWWLVGMSLETINACGYKNVMVCTDGGQVENPNWEIALEEYMQYLSDHGIPEEQLRYMTHDIQAGLLGIR